MEPSTGGNIHKFRKSITVANIKNEISGKEKKPENRRLGIRPVSVTITPSVSVSVSLSHRTSPSIIILQMQDLKRVSKDKKMKIRCFYKYKQRMRLYLFMNIIFQRIIDWLNILFFFLLLKVIF